MYKNLLAAIDLTEGPARRVLETAKELAGPDTRIQVLHVVEPQYVQYSFDPTFSGAMTRSLESEAQATAQRRIAELCAPFGINEGNQHVTMGHAATLIHKFASDNDCDLIVIGSHGYRGWQRLLGSTANAVLHGAPVDVWTCHISKET